MLSCPAASLTKEESSTSFLPSGSTKTAHILPNHLIKVIDGQDTLQDVISHLTADSYQLKALDSLIGRSMLVAKAERIPVECVVRGYLSGSAWAEYKETGKVGDIHLAPGNEGEPGIVPTCLYPHY